jgi:hypothetical protein
MVKFVEIRTATAEDYAKRGFWTVGTFHRAAVPVKKTQELQGAEPAAPESDTATKTDSTGGKHG